MWSIQWRAEAQVTSKPRQRSDWAASAASHSIKPATFTFFKLDNSGTLTIVAGKWMDYSGTQTITGDGGLATQATISGAVAIVVDPQGNLFFVDGINVRKVAAGTGTISTVYSAGPGAGESDLALDGQGNLYVAYRGCPAAWEWTRSR